MRQTSARMQLVASMIINLIFRESPLFSPCTTSPLSGESSSMAALQSHE